MTLAPDKDGVFSTLKSYISSLLILHFVDGKCEDMQGQKWRLKKKGKKRAGRGERTFSSC